MAGKYTPPPPPRRPPSGGGATPSKNTPPSGALPEYSKFKDQPIPPSKPSKAAPATTSKTPSTGRPLNPPPPPPRSSAADPSSARFRSNGLDRRMKVDSSGRVSSDFKQQDADRKTNREFEDMKMKKISAIKDPKEKQKALNDNASQARRLEAGTRTPPPPPRGAVTDSAGRKHNPSLFTKDAAGRANMGSLRPPSKNDGRKYPAPPPPPSRPAASSAPAKKGVKAAVAKVMKGRGKGR